MQFLSQIEEGKFNPDNLRFHGNALKNELIEMEINCAEEVNST